MDHVIIVKHLVQYWFRDLNIADYLSLYRILATPVLIILIILNQQMVFTVFLTVSLATDMVDGFIARKLKITTDRGARLDSYGDALTFVVGVIGIAYFKWQFFSSNYKIILLAFIPYFFQLILAWWKYGKPSSFHTYMAKLAAFLQGTFMLSLLYFEVNYLFFYITLTISVVETLEEIVLIFHFPEWKANVKGLYWVLKGQ